MHPSSRKYQVDSSGERMHSTADVITVFARQGIAIETIARAMALPSDRVLRYCQRALNDGDLEMVPPVSPDDSRSAMLAEVVNLRAHLDDAQMKLRDLSGSDAEEIEVLRDRVNLTTSEAKVVAVLLRRERMSKGAIYNAIYGAKHDSEQPEPKIIDVYLCKIRRKLGRFGVNIETIWGTGYKIDKENAARLREALGVPVQGSCSIVPTVEEMTAP